MHLSSWEHSLVQDIFLCYKYAHQNQIILTSLVFKSTGGTKSTEGAHKRGRKTSMKPIVKYSRRFKRIKTDSEVPAKPTEEAIIPVVKENTKVNPDPSEKVETILQENASDDEQVFYDDFDDIELPDESEIALAAEASLTAAYDPTAVIYPMKEEEEKAQQAAFQTTLASIMLKQEGADLDQNAEAKFVCRHCGKRYRWKSTLRRHENVECGGKEPSHQCPYCPYKAKQRGNLGVHVRKHHDKTLTSPRLNRNS